MNLKSSQVFLDIIHNIRLSPLAFLVFKQTRNLTFFFKLLRICILVTFLGWEQDILGRFLCVCVCVCVRERVRESEREREIERESER